MELNRRGRSEPRLTCILMVVAVFVLIGFMLLGCETQSAVQIQEPFKPTIPRQVSIEPCVDRTGFKGSRDIEEEATQTFAKKLEDAGLFEITADAPIILTCDIEQFKEGSALKRWVMPGWGATQAQVVVMVWEKPGDKVLATFRSQSSVKAGGFYTIGASQYIFGVAFDDIIKQLKAWVTGGEFGREDETKK